jgi:hypothetical protein
VNRRSLKPPVPLRKTLQYPAHHIQLANGKSIRLSTVVTVNMPESGFDNWDIVTNSDSECFLHKYFRNNSRNKLDIRMNVSIVE